MKNFYILIILVSQILSYNLHGQVTTPKGTNVDYLIINEGNVALFESEAAAWLSAHEGWDEIVEKTGNATAVYNCHSWAWYKYDGGSNTCCINAWLNSDFENFNEYDFYDTPPEPNNIKKYWSDGSYFELASSSDATKVWYGSCWRWDSFFQMWVNPCDHSAVRLPSGTYESKWGK